MLSIKIKRKGNLEKIVAGLAAAASKGVDDAIENTQKDAVMYKRHLTGGGGTLDKNIVTEKQDELQGRVYTNHPALVFVEYGTGYKKDPDYPHIGTTKTFIDSNKHFWYVPVDKVDRPIGPKIRIGDEEYYIAFSQEAKPFMRTAAFNRHYKNVDDLKKSIENLIKENAI